uniref:Major facilitator superfamily associated domain-containing protein n=1 Tax=Amphimedon queenslandica TaxID=400682 RepID=A0A1X7UPX7_AMPQE
LWTFFSFAYITFFCGNSSFAANIIQYNIDQLVGASADQLNSVIYLHILSGPLVLFPFYLLQCLFYSTSGVSVSLVLVSHSFFKHKLENISLIKNPIKLIVRVLCYARKHKYPENRSALTYWEEEAPSRLDLGKDKYGGPFTEEEVEDVKTVFRMLPLFLGFMAINLSDDVYWSAIDSFTLPTCLAVTDILYYFCSVIAIICFYKYIPSMLTRMSVGIFLAFIVTVSKVIIFFIERPHPNINNFISLEFTVAQSPVNMRGVMVGLWYAIAYGLGFLISTTFKFLFDCKSQYICTSFYYYMTKSVLVLIILIVFVILAKRYKYQIIRSLTFILMYPVSLEFTVAQSPVHMRGVMVGLWYVASWGIGYLISTMLKFPFDCESQYICTSFYYYMAKSVLVLIILIVFVILAKRYKYRVRKNEVNIVQIVDDHYQRYLNQREQFGIDTDSDSSTD